jgi:hypothetical protein
MRKPITLEAGTHALGADVLFDIDAKMLGFS